MVNHTNHYRRDLTGDIFGRLTVERQYIRLTVCDEGRTESLWLCKCLCGAEHIARMKNLLSGGTRSCGCLAAEVKRMRRADKKGKRFEVSR
jgi:hypothetical protein